MSGSLNISDRSPVLPLDFDAGVLARLPGQGLDRQPGNPGLKVPQRPISPDRTPSLKTPNPSPRPLAPGITPGNGMRPGETEAPRGGSALKRLDMAGVVAALYEDAGGVDRAKNVLSNLLQTRESWTDSQELRTVLRWSMDDHGRISVTAKDDIGNVKAGMRVEIGTIAEFVKQSGIRFDRLDDRESQTAVQAWQRTGRVPARPKTQFTAPARVQLQSSDLGLNGSPPSADGRVMRRTLADVQSSKGVLKAVGELGMGITHRLANGTTLTNRGSSARGFYVQVAVELSGGRTARFTVEYDSKRKALDLPKGFDTKPGTAPAPRRTSQASPQKTPNEEWQEYRKKFPDLADMVEQAAKYDGISITDVMSELRKGLVLSEALAKLRDRGIGFGGVPPNGPGKGTAVAGGFQEPDNAAKTQMTQALKKTGIVTDDVVHIARQQNVEPLRLAQQIAAATASETSKRAGGEVNSVLAAMTPESLAALAKAQLARRDVAGAVRSIAGLRVAQAWERQNGRYNRANAIGAVVRSLEANRRAITQTNTLPASALRDLEQAKRAFNNPGHWTLEQNLIVPKVSVLRGHSLDRWNALVGKFGLPLAKRLYDANLRGGFEAANAALLKSRSSKHLTTNDAASLHLIGLSTGRYEGSKYLADHPTFHDVLHSLSGTGVSAWQEGINDNVEELIPPLFGSTSTVKFDPKLKLSEQPVLIQQVKSRIDAAYTHLQPWAVLANFGVIEHHFADPTSYPLQTGNWQADPMANARRAKKILSDYGFLAHFDQKDSAAIGGMIFGMGNLQSFESIATRLKSSGNLTRYRQEVEQWVEAVKEKIRTLSVKYKMPKREFEDRCLKVIAGASLMRRANPAIFTVDIPLDTDVGTGSLSKIDLSRYPAELKDLRQAVSK